MPIPHAVQPIALALALALAHAAFANTHSAQTPWPGDVPPGVVLKRGDPDGARWSADFFPASTHSDTLPSPDLLLGQPMGSRAARHGEILHALRLWDGLSPRLSVESYGQTHAGRELVLAVIAGERWRPRLAEVRAELRRLAGLDGGPRAGDVEPSMDLPAIAWLGYGIHGDETSATDAALALVWHFAAATSPDVDALLEEVVLVIDPCLNPDGRERILNQFEELRGHASTFDHAAMQRGRWPFGRGNHYLFDLNRDWLLGIGAETRARWRAVLAWMPQLFVDGHEMTPLDTFLFYPQAAAHNPLLPSELGVWQTELAAGAAKAFDGFGWSYYTREWADAWAPFYSDAWGSLNGAIGMLYEMARGGGQPVQRASGEIVPYRQSVHRQVAATLANVETLRANRAAILADWIAARRAPLAAEGAAVFYVSAQSEPERLALLVETLVAQDIEVDFLDEAVATKDATGADLELAPGALRIAAAQPQGRLVRALFELDPRLPDAYLAEERTELERFGRSKIYDGTSWSVVHSFGLEGSWGEATQARHRRLSSAAELATARAERGLFAAPTVGAIVPLAADAGEPVAYAIDGHLDAAPRFAIAAMELALVVHHAELPFTAAGRSWPAGSLILRRHENGADFDGRVERAAQSARGVVWALGTSRSPDAGPDLGGGHFRQLERPRIALLANAPTAADGFGHVWHHLDRRLGAPVTMLDAQALGEHDLRRYNTLIVPPAASDLASLLATHADALRAWIAAGGTLIAMGSSAVAVADPDLDLCSVRERGAVLEELPAWRAAARRELGAGDGPWDFTQLWSGGLSSAEGGFVAEGEELADGAESREKWLRRFAPAGVHLVAELAPRHWLTAGLPRRLTVPFGGDHALLARDPVAAAARFGEGPSVRAGGLLWPEARERLELSVYTAVESRGFGQVILFAADPVFRGQHLASGRLLSHAVAYGPGLGASAPIPR